jgi:hypothetical protein
MIKHNEVWKGYCYLCQIPFGIEKTRSKGDPTKEYIYINLIKREQRRKK